MKHLQLQPRLRLLADMVPAGAQTMATFRCG